MLGTTIICGHLCHPLISFCTLQPSGVEIKPSDLANRAPFALSDAQIVVYGCLKPKSFLNP